MTTEKHGIKSSYELALERMGGGNPDEALTSDQKKEISEIEQRAQAKVAEIEVMQKAEVAKARGKGEFGEAEAIEERTRSQIKKIREEADRDKDRVRGH